MIEAPTRCPECEGTLMSWFVHKTNHSGVVDGRLRMHDVGVEFVLGCDECGATVMTVPADTIAASMSVPHLKVPPAERAVRNES